MWKCHKIQMFLEEVTITIEKIISKHPPLFPLAMNPVKHDFSKTESALVDVSSLTAKRRLERRLGKI